MAWLEAALLETAEHPHPERLDTFRASLDAAWIDEALQATGTATLRRRRLPADQVIWLVLGMALQRDRPIHEVVSKLDLAMPDKRSAPVAPSAVTQARKRVGERPLQWLFERSSRQWSHQSASEHRWRGLSLYGIDGTSLRVADSEVNRAHFGGASNGARGDSGYPLMRLTALMALRSHLLAAVRFGPFSESEHVQAHALWPEIPDDSLTILDKNYYSASTLLGISTQGTQRHWLLRVRRNAKWTVIGALGRHDALVKIKTSHQARSKDPSLPETFVARAISYQHPRSEGRQWLLSSLHDPEKYPANELVGLYRERWEIELGYDEIKTHMLNRPRQEAVRSRTVEGVRQEVWGVLLAYNLVRLEMERIADEAQVPPSRVSFVMALRYIRDEWGWCAVASPGTIPAKLRRMRERVSHFVLPERRSDRYFPRAVKIKMSNYRKKPTKNVASDAK
jgi:hypothetical protein